MLTTDYFFHKHIFFDNNNNSIVVIDINYIGSLSANNVLWRGICDLA